MLTHMWIAHNININTNTNTNTYTDTDTNTYIYTNPNAKIYARWMCGRDNLFVNPDKSLKPCFDWALFSCMRLMICGPYVKLIFSCKLILWNV